MKENNVTISTKEYAEFIAAKHTLMLITNLMNKEVDAKDSGSTYIDVDKYIQILDCYWDAMEVNNAEYPEAF
jgi:hypothetical protein